MERVRMNKAVRVLDLAFAVRIALVTAGVAIGYGLVAALNVGVELKSAVRQGPALVSPGWTAQNECERSLRESEGFYCENDVAWDQRMEIVRRQMPMQCQQGRCLRDNGIQWYWKNFEPEWSCFEERVGDYGHSGKWVCDMNLIRMHRAAGKQPCLVYSVGFNGTYSFELALHEHLPKCQIFAIDGSEASRAADLPPFVTHKPWDVVKSARSPPGTPVHSLRTIMQQLGHKGMELDILKVDLLGSEYHFIAELFRDDYMPFRQILIKVHTESLNSKLFAQLRRFGFVIAHKEVYYPDRLIHQYVLVRLTRDLFTTMIPDPIVKEVASD